MTFTQSVRFRPLRAIPAHTAVSLFFAALASACGGGGGGAVVEPPESAVLQSVAAAQVLEGGAGSTSQLEFVATLDKPAVKGLDITFSTASTSKVGVESTGSAKGGTSCAVPGTDFVSVINNKVTVAKGQNTIRLSVTVCGDSTFEPNETLKINYTSAGSLDGSAIGTIVNDDAGGLNGTGVVTGMGGITAFGRDTNVLTNSAVDGALGFSFEQKPSSASWNCTEDKVSGLTWQRVSTTTSTFAGLAGIVGVENGKATCGYGDWRVPTVNELLTLVDSSRAASYGAVNADREGVLEAAMSGQFWTSESQPAPGAVDAWFVDFVNGGAVSREAKTDVRRVRLVRGSANPVTCDNSGPRFTDLADSTVADGKTGLMWKQCQEGSSGAACTTGTPLTFNTVSEITDRLGTVNATSSSLGIGYSDWRIPTKNELASLVNRACTGNSAILSSVFPANEPVSYIAGTPNANNTSQYWFVDFVEGSIGVGAVSNKRLRLVRGGQ